ncbi:MAG: transcription-repair coupling factor [Candidatus Omnitrophica bacterium]|nr:transcription-repair coupling factor [Candidatus Omnitrophota bacterium]
MLEFFDFSSMPEKFPALINLTGKREKYFVSGGAGTSFFSCLLACMFAKVRKNFMVILPEEESAETFFQDIVSFSGGENVRHLPSPEFFSGSEQSVSAVMFDRVTAFTEIAASKKPLIIVSQPAALLKKIPELKEFGKSAVSVNAGGSLRRDVFIERLLGYGYNEAGVVEEPGEFARRGGIVDVFPLDSQFPLRVEFLGNRINSVRKFEPANQISFEKIQGFMLLPLNETFAGHESAGAITQLKEAALFFIEPGRFYLSPMLKELENRGLYKEEDFKKAMERAVVLQEGLPSPEVKGPRFLFNVFPPAGRFRSDSSFIWNPFEGEKLAVFSDTPAQEKRLKEILEEKGADTSCAGFFRGMLSSGFSFPEANLTVLSNDELFSRYKTRRQSRRVYAESMPLSSSAGIKEGDYVVHYNEGIGRFLGMREVAVRGAEKKEEFAVLEYEGGDKLYVPLNQVELIHKYIGSETPRLSVLAGKNWLKVRDKVKNAIRDLAGDLYALYLERKKEKGFGFLPDEEFQREFDGGFIYRETDDQLRVINEVKEDMVSDGIMDRIVCGDSGYGKTEVALRAACKAVISGTQAVVLVPTTVLALQHFLTFKERFADFPVRVEMLSRLVQPSKQKEIIADVAKGKVDIVIGTHRLLQADVKFSKPGLLMVDEEQRFGVVHKEKIKNMFRKIDVLTLTATPIPRTLYMAVSGLRDISMIETPPQGRLSVITYAGRYNEKLIKEAVLREVERKGQVFYLHNRIYDIEKVTNRLKQMLPFAPRIEFAHGRMEPEKLASIMKRFSSGDIDVLVATTIVENGIDIPRANTLIVDNAHTFGLSDLYQLRGRVGRYKWRAYAYFLIPGEALLTDIARERLSALQELSKPGSGYRVALKDLEIRGAGNILGREQHGFVEQVGFNLYCRFWKEIMEEMKGVRHPVAAAKEMAANIPSEYVQNPSLRFYLYQRIAGITGKGDAKALIEEMTDRFGPPPSALLSAIKKGS